MIRSADSRAGLGELALWQRASDRSELVLCHAELINVEATIEQQRLNLGVLVGQLIVVGVDEYEVRVRWDDPWTVSPGEDIRQLLSDDEAVLLRCVADSATGVEVEDFFPRLGWMQDLVAGRRIVIESAEIAAYASDGPRATGVGAPDTPSADLVQGIQTWLAEQDFVDNGFPTNFIRRIDDQVAVCAAVSPQSFVMENTARRHPVAVQLGVAHRDVNQFSDWFASRPRRPWRWTMFERVPFFNPKAPICWAAETDLDEPLQQLGVALDAAERFAQSDERLRSYLYRDDPVHAAFHRRHRIAWEAIAGWGEPGERELAAWEQVTVSKNAVRSFEATLRRYLADGKTPYWFET